MTYYDDWMSDGWHASAEKRARLKCEVRAQRVPSSCGSAASDDADTFSFSAANGRVVLRNSQGEPLEIKKVRELPISHALLTASGDYVLSENEELIVKNWTRFVLRVGVKFTGANKCLNNVSNCGGPEIEADRPVPFDTGEQSVLAATQVDFIAEGCRIRVMHTSRRGRLLDHGVYFFACSRAPTEWTWDQAIAALEQAGATSVLCAELADDIRTLRSEVCTPAAAVPTPSMLSTCRRRGQPDACYVSAEAVDSGIVFVSSCDGCSSGSRKDCCTRILLAAGAPSRCIFSLDRVSGRGLESLSLPGYDPGSLLRMDYRKVDMSWAGSMRNYRHVDQGLIPPRTRPKERSRLYVTGGVELSRSAVLQATPKVTVRCLRDLARAKAALQANPRLAADAFCLLPVDAEMQSWLRSNAEWIERIPVPSSTGRRWLNLGVSRPSDETGS